MDKSEYVDNFKDKKITVMGLGLLGRGINVTKFLADCGADLIVTDLKDEDELEPALAELSDYDDIEYVLGRHRLSEFTGRDIIIKAAGVPKDSKYIKRARENDIPVEMDASLFAKLAPDNVRLVGVTGTRGKSTVTHLIQAILDANSETTHLGGNVRGRATLPLLDKVKPGDFVVLELDSWQLQGFGEAEISPNYAVFTNFLRDHQDYYKNMREYFEDKSHIFRHQEKGDYLITSEDSFEAIQKYLGEDAHEKVKATMAMANPKTLLDGYESPLRGEHNRQNLALAVQFADILTIDSSVAQQALREFKPLPGRMQYVRKILNRSIYNDNNATTPDATVAAIKTLTADQKESENLTLIAGGSDKELDTTELERVIKRQVENVILLPGTGTDEIRFKLYGDERINIDEAETVKEALEMALSMSSPNDIILFSPAFASFEQFANEYEREEALLEAIDELK